MIKNVLRKEKENLSALTSDYATRCRVSLKSRLINSRKIMNKKLQWLKKYWRKKQPMEKLNYQTRCQRLSLRDLINCDQFNIKIILCIHLTKFVIFFRDRTKFAFFCDPYRNSRFFCDRFTKLISFFKALVEIRVFSPLRMIENSRYFSLIVYWNSWFFFHGRLTKYAIFLQKRLLKFPKIFSGRMKKIVICFWD